jgi:hypothetical protein
MLECLGRQATDRKLRLFCVACCRRALPFVKDRRAHRAVHLAEGFADGTVSRDELQRFQNDLKLAHWWSQFRGAGRRDATAATRATASPSPLTIADAEFISSACATAVGDRARDSDAQMERCAKTAAEPDEMKVQCVLLRDVFGDPFRPQTDNASWHTRGLIRAAQAIYDDEAFDRLPLLAKRLQEAGCADSEILDHCCNPGQHVRGCWVIDLIMRK